MDDVDDRVRKIVDLMLAGEWDGKRALELAQEYGCKLVTVRDWSRQAGRVLRFLRGPDEEYRDRLLANLDFAGRKALELERTFTNKNGEEHTYAMPDVNAYIKAQVEQAKLLKLDRAEGGSAQLSLAELADLMRAHGCKVELPKDEDGSRGATESGTTTESGADYEPAEADEGDSSEE